MTWRFDGKQFGLSQMATEGRMVNEVTIRFETPEQQMTVRQMYNP